MKSQNTFGRGSWVREWSRQTQDALQDLEAAKRQTNADYNARIRMIRDAQRGHPNSTPTPVLNLIRAPLAGLR